MPKPVISRVVNWLAAGTSDLADSVERLNRDLDNRENNPHWSRAVMKDTLVIISPRRWIPFGKKHPAQTLDDLDFSSKSVE
jgi:hypothetical protein